MGENLNISLHPQRYFWEIRAPSKTINSPLSLADCSSSSVATELTEITFSKNLVEKFSTSINTIFKGLNDFLTIFLNLQLDE